LFVCLRFLFISFCLVFLDVSRIQYQALKEGAFVQKHWGAATDHKAIMSVSESIEIFEHLLVHLSHPKARGLVYHTLAFPAKAEMQELLLVHVEEQFSKVLKGDQLSEPDKEMMCHINRIFEKEAPGYYHELVTSRSVCLTKVARGFFDAYVSSREPFWPKKFNTSLIEGGHPDTDRWADCEAVTAVATAFKAAHTKLHQGEVALKAGVHATQQTMATTSVLRPCEFNI
jgi:hypothetical protein